MILDYNGYYIYPPRPQNAINKEYLNNFYNNRFILQPKANGSNVSIYMNEKGCKVMNRHNQTMHKFDVQILHELRSIYLKQNLKGYLVVNGEYMNKAKCVNNNKFDNKFLIFDILVYNNNYLLGTSFNERVELNNSLFGNIECDIPHLYNITDKIYMIKTFNIDDLSDYESENKSNTILNLFNDITSNDIFEGLVIKNKDSKLERGTTPINNNKSQFKCRIATKNYNF